MRRLQRVIPSSKALPSSRICHGREMLVVRSNTYEGHVGLTSPQPLQGYTASSDSTGVSGRPEDSIALKVRARDELRKGQWVGRREEKAEKVRMSRRIESAWRRAARTGQESVSKAGE